MKVDVLITNYVAVVVVKVIQASLVSMFPSTILSL